MIQSLDPVPVFVRDPDDIVILAIAITGKADFLVTGDLDLLVLADDPQVLPLQITALAAFVELLDPD